MSSGVALLDRMQLKVAAQKVRKHYGLTRLPDEATVRKEIASLNWHGRRGVLDDSSERLAARLGGGAHAITISTFERRPPMSKKVKKVKKVQKAERLSLVYEPLSKLKAWEFNPRVNDEAADKLCGLLEQYGFISPIIATPDGTIRAGHTRFKAAQKLGLTEVPVLYVAFDSEDEAEMYSIADNKSHEWSQWNVDMLRDRLSQQQQLTGEELSEATGFSTLEIEGIRSDYREYKDFTFAEAVERFEEESGEGELSGRKHLWCWFAVPDAQAREALKERYASKRRASELDVVKVLKALGIEHGPLCDKCEGTGVPSTGKGRCDACQGTGILSREEATPKKVRKVAK